jgi:hypothetical protein
VVTLEQNDWAQAANHADRYWLNLIYNCDSVAVLFRISNPFEKLVARQTGAIRTHANEIKRAAE